MDHMHADQPPSPFAELTSIYQQIRERELHETVDGSMIRELLDASRLIEGAHSTAAEMQLGAEGFDNTEAARLYSRVQEHLLAAARELVEASETLKASCLRNR